MRRALSAISVGVKIYWTTLLTMADVYHSHEAYPLPVCFFVAKLRHKKLVYDAHELYQSKGCFNPAMLERIFIHKADAVINVNSARANVLRQRYGLTQQTIVMNCPSKKIPQKSEQLRQTLNIPANHFIVMYHGGFYPRERALDELVRAAPHLPENVHVVIMGFDSKGVRKTLINLAADLHVSDRVRILDPIPPHKLVEFATGADIGVIPQVLVGDNQRFANPNKLFDYMASGLAVIATDAPTITPIIRDFGIGEVFTEPRADEIASTIMQMVSEPSYLEACKRASRRAAEEVFFWEKEEQKLISLYLNLGEDIGRLVPSKVT
jgi:glycosyltransferase involved in cell wall biosynthesis